MPFIIAQKGHIINIGSTAGKEVYKDGNVYCASKHAVDAISKAQRIDLLPYQIKVTAIHPGAADTEFSVVRFKGDAEKAKAVYTGYTPLMAEDIADTVWYVANTPAHVCINDLVITCTAQANSMYLQKENYFYFYPKSISVLSPIFNVRLMPFTAASLPINELSKTTSSNAV
jgi:NADP-dependent 3-hydroxy acid dehydrogenase YdfG